MTLSVDTSRLRGPFTKGATIYTNDPVAKRVALHLRGRVRKYIYVKPGPYVRVIAVEGGTATRTLEFTSGTKDRELVFTGVDVDPALKGKIETRLIRGKDKRSYKLEVTNRIKRIGAYRGKLVIHTNYPQKPTLSLKVLVDVRGPIQITPGRIHFGRLRSIQQAAKRKRSIWVKRVAGPHFKITGLDYDHSLFKVKTKERIPGDDYLIFVSLTPKAIHQGKVRGKLVIHTDNGRPQTSEVPLFAEIVRN